MKAKGLFDAIGGDALHPQDDRALAIIEEMGDKKALVWVHTARWPEHHRLAFAVMQRIADAVGQPVEIILLSLKYETGRFDYISLMDGRVIENPHSIAFESMDQADFRQFWTDAVEVIKDQWLPRVGMETFEEIREMLSGPYGGKK